MFPSSPLAQSLSQPQTVRKCVASALLIYLTLLQPGELSWSQQEVL